MIEEGNMNEEVEEHKEVTKEQLVELYEESAVNP